MPREPQPFIVDIERLTVQCGVQDLPREDQRQLLLTVPFSHMSHILQALPGQACMDALLAVGAPLCKDLLLSMPNPTSRKLLHAASMTDLAKLIQVSLLIRSPSAHAHLPPVNSGTAAANVLSTPSPISGKLLHDAKLIQVILLIRVPLTSCTPASSR